MVVPPAEVQIENTPMKSVLMLWLCLFILSCGQEPESNSYYNDAVIRSIYYRGVRSNSLFFDVVLKTSSFKREIMGRFSLFYRTENEGKIYSWYVDEIMDL